jgi:hypothetical protein
MLGAKHSLMFGHMNKSSIAAIEPDASPERRKALRLIQYWEQIRGAKKLPSENDVDPDAIADIWDSCFLLQVRDMSRTDGNFTYLGKHILDAFRGGLSGDSCGELVSPNIMNLGQNFNDLLDNQRPQLQEGKFRNIKGDLVRYRQALVPLGYQQDRVDAIFGCMSLKIFHDE